MKKISILGTVGIPALYGGFETLAENLVRFQHDNRLSVRMDVYCSAKNYPDRDKNYLGANLHYIRLNANGMSSILYDIVSLFSTVRRRSDVILLLGVSGAIALPVVRLLSRARVITNIDGIEWKREKWRGFARRFLRFSELMAVLFSHEVIADNGGIAQHVTEYYGRNCHVIAYGGDHAMHAPPKPKSTNLPSRYALALCRIEPENNVGMILEAFARKPELSLVFVGNWSNCAYGRKLKETYARYPHLHLLDAVYDPGVLYSIRRNASLYIHGHSAGGTNPSLVEIMHFGIPVLAYDCIFNRFTTDDKALYFRESDSLGTALESLTSAKAQQIGTDMCRIAHERYTWENIGKAYFNRMLKN